LDESRDVTVSALKEKRDDVRMLTCPLKPDQLYTGDFAGKLHGL